MTNKWGSEEDQKFFLKMLLVAGVTLSKEQWKEVATYMGDGCTEGGC